MPMGVSRAVQKWNWCGVEGLSSVATTWPSGGMSWGMSQCGGPGAKSVVGRSGAEKALDRVHAIEQPLRTIPDRTEGGALGKQASRDQVGAFGRAIFGRDLHPHQSVEEIPTLPGPQAKRPFEHRCDASR